MTSKSLFQRMLLAGFAAALALPVAAADRPRQGRRQLSRLHQGRDGRRIDRAGQRRRQSLRGRRRAALDRSHPSRRDPGVQLEQRPEPAGSRHDDRRGRSGDASLPPLRRGAAPPAGLPRRRRHVDIAHHAARGLRHRRPACRATTARRRPSARAASSSSIRRAVSCARSRAAGSTRPGATIVAIDRGSSADAVRHHAQPGRPQGRG